MSNISKIEIVNKIIEKITTTSRHFFLYEGVRSEIRVIKGKPYYFDEYSKKEIYLFEKETKYNAYYYFSHGGTLRGLVFGEFARFIKGGQVLEEYSGLNATYWGISKDEIKELMDYARLLGYFTNNQNIEK